MTHSSHNSYHDQALKRLLSGEIDEAEYKRLSAYIADVESLPRRQPAPVPYEPSDESRGAITLPRVARPVRPQSGDIVDKYQLESMQRGGMGEAWKARDTKASRFVALKFLPAELSGNEDEIARIQKTFKLVEQLDHPQICRVFDLNEHLQWGWYQVMRWVDGQTLSQYRRESVGLGGPLPLKGVIALLRPAAEALDYAHCRNVLHRDIKPQNLMRDAAGNVFVIDFGLAAEVRSGLTRVSQKSIDLAGTRLYLAPELWEGGAASPLTDQYALGVTAYEPLAGSWPFASDDPAIHAYIVAQKPTPTIPHLSTAAVAALIRTLAKAPADRFGNCREFIDAIDSAPHAQPLGLPAAQPRQRVELKGGTDGRSGPLFTLGDPEAEIAPTASAPENVVLENQSEAAVSDDQCTKLGHPPNVNSTSGSDHGLDYFCSLASLVYVRVPDLGDRIDTAYVEELNFEFGDVVSQGAALLTLETDKAIIDINSPVSGTVRELLVASGECVKRGAVLLVVEVLSEAGSDRLPPNACQAISPGESPSSVKPAVEAPRTSTPAISAPTEESQAALPHQPSAAHQTPPSVAINLSERMASTSITSSYQYRATSYDTHPTDLANEAPSGLPGWLAVICLIVTVIVASLGIIYPSVLFGPIGVIVGGILPLIIAAGLKGLAGYGIKGMVMGVALSAGFSAIALCYCAAMLFGFYCIMNLVVILAGSGSPSSDYMLATYGMTGFVIKCGTGVFVGQIIATIYAVRWLNRWASQAS